jgi:hypothetical protein
MFECYSDEVRSLTLLGSDFPVNSYTSRSASCCYGSHAEPRTARPDVTRVYNQSRPPVTPTDKQRTIILAARRCSCREVNAICLMNKGNYLLGYNAV